jgi:hypothetical protein
MTNLTFAVSAEVRKEMKRHANIKWSEVVRRAIEAELARLHLLDRLLESSQLKEEDAVKMGREIRRKAAERSRNA